VKIISRSEWGATPFTPEQVFWPSGVSLHVHHTAGPQNQPVKEIERFHIKVRGWPAIGYSYLVDARGNIYEGRGPNVKGAHSPPVNDQPSVALIGLYSIIAPSKAQRAAVWDLLDHINAGQLRGHRDSFPTSCPGDAAYQSVVLRGRPKVTKPQPEWSTLRLVLRPKDGNARQWSGRAAKGPVVWIARNGIDPGTDVALAYGGNVWRDRKDAQNVAINLTRRYF